MKKYFLIPFAIIAVNCLGQQLPGFGLTYLNYTDLFNNPGDDSVQQTTWKKNNIGMLGAPLIRQMQNRDLTWENMEKLNDIFSFLKSDSLIIINPTSQFIGTLLHESGGLDNPLLSPWGSNSSSDRINYISTVVDHYKNTIDFWEIANENSHSWKKGICSPFQYASLLQEISPAIYAVDSNSNIIISGLGNPEDQWDSNDSNIVWLDSVLQNL